ncbi:MAG: EscU/YscU/HrcU family type III secretion system export apparatus switch protein [Deltaproteobacteria bacterium]|jgi:flagellar biosynthetic protein FlhB|nr:EscU/YscU/HrcU family type III secretion system export apparatus switch protein [Deltaproteobacteria bacterium]
MGESSSQEKTEEATPKRLRDARKKGQVAKSRDLNTIVILIAAFITILFMRGYIGEQLRGVLTSNFNLISRPDLNVETLFLQAHSNFMTYVKIVIPFGIVMIVVAIAVGFFQVGPIFTGESMKPQMKRINAIENLKNMFKITTLVELLKNIAKMSLIFLLAYLVVTNRLREVVLTVKGTPDQSGALAAQLLVEFLVKVFIVFIMIAIIDLFVQRWNYKKQMRMTKEEVKREYKQDEGDPLIKSARRQLHQELAMSDTKQSVKSADAVITNPTELAIAIKYDDSEMAAPQIMAKGQRLFAQTIREYAEDYGIPIIENVPLAWTLIELDIGDEIPEDLYAAIAEILVYVYRLKNSQEQSEADAPNMA